MQIGNFSAYATMLSKEFSKNDQDLRKDPTEEKCLLRVFPRGMWVYDGLIVDIIIVREKGRDLTQSYDKSPYTDRNIQKQRDNTEIHPKTYTTIAGRLRTVSWT